MKTAAVTRAREAVYMDATAAATATTANNMTAKQFKTYRKKMGLTQKELGYALGLTRVSINRIENGSQVLNNRTVLQMGVAWHVFKRKGGK